MQISIFVYLKITIIMDDPGVNSVDIPIIKEEYDNSVSDMNSNKELSQDEDGLYCSNENSDINLQTLSESSVSDEELKRLRTKMVEEENRAFIMARELMYKNLYSEGEQPSISSNILAHGCGDDSQIYNTLTATQYINLQMQEAKKAEEESLMYVLPGTPKPFCCTLCDYRSVRKDKMKRHLTIHSDEKPLACPMCSYRCARKDKLKKHMQTHGIKEIQKKGQKRKITDENDDNAENSTPSISDYYITNSKVITTSSMDTAIHTGDNAPTTNSTFSHISTANVDVESHAVDSTPTTNSTLDASFKKVSECFDAHSTLVPYIPSFLGKSKAPIKKWQYACSICDRKYKLEDSLIRHMEIHTGTIDSGILQSVSKSSELSNETFNTFNNIHTDQNNEHYKLPSHSMFSQGIEPEAEDTNSVSNMAAFSNGDIHDPVNFLESSIEIKEEFDRELDNGGDMEVKEERCDYSDDEIPSHIAEPMVVMEECEDSFDAVNSNFNQEVSDSFNSELYQSNINIINNAMKQTAIFTEINKNPIRKWANVCPICDRKYKLRESLIGHMDTHKNDTNYHKYMELINQDQAGASEKDIPKGCLRKTDVENVSETKPKVIEPKVIELKMIEPKVIVCTYCDHKCSSMSKFIIHERTHTKEKPFVCTICDFKCARKDKLKNHMLRHTNEKPFACSECDYRCKRTEALKQHMQTHVDHKRTKSVDSLIIAEAYNNSEHQSLPNIHINNNGMSPSGLKYINSSYLEDKYIPGKKWSFACPICERKFKFKQSLEKHMEVHNSSNFVDTNIIEKTDDIKSYKCPVCNYVFPQRSALDMHMMTHTGEKPFACGICQYSCNQKGNLKRHMLQLHGRFLESEYNASTVDDYEVEPNEDNSNKTEIIEPNNCIEESKEKIVTNNVNNDSILIGNSMEREYSNNTEMIEPNTFINDVNKEKNISNNVNNDSTLINNFIERENSNNAEIIEPNTCIEEENKEKLINNVNNDSTLIDNFMESEEEILKVQTDINHGELTVIDNVQSILQTIDNYMIEESID